MVANPFPLPAGFEDFSEPQAEESAPSLKPKRVVTRYRSIWISDVHLGLPGAKTEMLHDFLKHTDSDFLYLVGDIIDFWQVRRGAGWPQVNNNVIRQILSKAKHGAKTYYIPGNHDEVLRRYHRVAFGNIHILTSTIHTAADGKRYLVIHGDQFDAVVTNRRWLALLGSRAYDWLLVLNRYFNAARKALGYPYWSLSAYLKHKVKNACTYISHFETLVANSARQHGTEGVICGHIHRAALTEMDGITYANDGDWVESCTALVEHFDGRLELLDWTLRRAHDGAATASATTATTPEIAHAPGAHQRRLVPAG